MAKEDPWAAYAKARELFHEGDAKQAADVMREHAEFTADRPSVAKAVARFEFGQGDYEKALEVLEGVPKDDLSANRLRILAHEKRRDWDAVLKVAQQTPLDDLHDHPNVCFAIASAAAINLDAERAIKAARLGLKQNPAHSAGMKALYGMLATITPPDQLADVVEAEMFGDGKGGEQVTGLLTTRRHGGLRPDDFKRLFHKAREKWPDAKQLAACELWLAEDAYNLTEPNDPIAAVKDLLQASAQTNKNLRSAVRAFESFDYNRLTRDIVKRSDTAGLSKSTMGPKDHIILQFGGTGNPGGRNEMFDAQYSAMGYGSIFLQDMDSLLFMNGIPTVASSFEETVKQLRAEIDSMSPTAQVTCIGASGGGGAALSYGTVLGVDRIICFSPITATEKSKADEFGDYRARGIVGRMNQLIPPIRRDMRAFLAAQDYASKIDVLYGAEHALDPLQAGNLKGMKNVTLYPVAGLSKHSTILHAVASGAFEDIIQGNMSAVDKMATR